MKKVKLNLTNMIDSKQAYKFYLEADRIALGKKTKLYWKAKRYISARSNLVFPKTIT